MWRKVLLFVIGIGAGLFAGIAGGSPAFAHNTFVESSPRDGEVLVAPPTSWSITFQKSVPLESASGSIINGNGTRTTLPGPRHGTTDNVIVFDLPAELAGAISARWRLVSTDGHVISGRVGFVVQDAAAAVPIPVAQPTETSVDEAGTTSDAIRTTLRFLNFAAIAIVMGLFFVELDIAAGALALQRARKMVAWGMGILAVVPAVQFLIFADDIRSDDESFTSAIGDALSLTPGAMLFLRLIAGLVLAWLATSIVRIGTISRSMITPLAVTGITYLIALGYVGHSRSQAAPWLGVPIDVVHTAAIGVWLGGLLTLVLVVVPTVEASAAITAFSRFGFVAERAVALIVVTGVIQTLRLHGNPINLFSSTHGLLLVAKIVVVGFMIRLAARNRTTLDRHRTASLASAERSRSLLLRATTLEIVFGGAVLAVTAVLVAVTPS